jgi:hypothetical protein
MPQWHYTQGKALFKAPSRMSAATEENHKRLQCSGRDSNRVPPEYNSETLPLGSASRPVIILNQTNPVQALTSYFFKVYISIIHLSLDPSSGLFTSVVSE